MNPWAGFAQGDRNIAALVRRALELGDDRAALQGAAQLVPRLDAKHGLAVRRAFRLAVERPAPRVLRASEGDLRASAPVQLRSAEAMRKASAAATVPKKRTKISRTLRPVSSKEEAEALMA
jgi:hypothetical protein